MQAMEVQSLAHAAKRMTPTSEGPVSKDTWPGKIRSWPVGAGQDHLVGIAIENALINVPERAG